MAKQRGAYKGRKKTLPPERAAVLVQRAGTGVSKALLARDCGISRETVYQYLSSPSRSHGRPLTAIDSGCFADEIVPVTVKGRKGAEIIVGYREGPWPGTSVDVLAGLRPLKARILPDLLCEQLHCRLHPLSFP